MTLEVGFVFLVILAAVVLFVSERFPVDHVAIGIPIVLLAGGVIDAEQAVSGLSHPATVTIAAMLVLSLGLIHTGAIDGISRWARGARLGGPTRRLLVLCLLVAAISPFLNNTAVVVLFLPVFLDLARHQGVPPSRYLIPLSFSAILGGTVTLIGTSTNLIVYGMAQSRGLDELSLFSIAPLGLVYLGVGLVYLFTLGRHLIPERGGVAELSEKYEVRRFMTELRVEEASPLAGQRLNELGWGEGEVVVVGIVRAGRTIHAPGPRRVIRAGDLLIVHGDLDTLLSFARDHDLSTPSDRAGHVDLESDEGHLVEILVTPGSPLIGRRPGQVRFRQRFDAVLLAVRHHPSAPGLGTSTSQAYERLRDRVFRAGDLLLVHGPADALERLADAPGFVPLGRVDSPPRPRPRALLAVAIMVAVVCSAGIGLVDILPAALGGVGLMVATGCVRLDEVYRDLDWTVLALLAGLVPLGVAMDQTGAAAWLSSGIASGLGPAGPVVAVGAFYLLTSVLTEFMSNQAAAIVLTPVAILAAGDLGMNPYALIVAVMFGASAAFMTPIGYPTNTLIYGPGGYRFSDFLRVGVPLNLLLLVTASLLIPWLWPA